ncbi:hypothetical protein RB2654_15340 [Rhodobacterales bacterium HTCC2654]|uniref:Uncharacterized protein n=1 Tax=Maritimibacter alkaliphilus HTCC2654 TaxID=314271 RepID=A3VHB7_9RHOB|nr:hypothetical protein RB2654_15340 [Rhodobacterales bacterium HTCC2654] [Maritimibacter alkaliphilus HTCC2654]
MAPAISPKHNPNMTRMKNCAVAAICNSIESPSLGKSGTDSQSGERPMGSSTNCSQPEQAHTRT